MEDVTALALAARAGDRVALSAFVSSTWSEVARLVTAVAGRELAEDATQDAYFRAIKALPSYRGEASARTWLLSIARRAAVDAVRATARRRRLTARIASRAEVRDRRRRPRRPHAHPSSCWAAWRPTGARPSPSPS